MYVCIYICIHVHTNPCICMCTYVSICLHKITMSHICISMSLSYHICIYTYTTLLSESLYQARMATTGEPTDASSRTARGARRIPVTICCIRRVIMGTSCTPIHLSLRRPAPCLACVQSCSEPKRSPPRWCPKPAALLWPFLIAWSRPRHTQNTQSNTANESY